MIYVKNQGQWKPVAHTGEADYRVGVMDITQRWVKARQVWVKSNGVWKKTIPAPLTSLDWQTVMNVNGIPRDAYQIKSQWEIIFYQSVTLNNMPRGIYPVQMVGGGGKGAKGYYGWTSNPPRVNVAEYLWAGGGQSGEAGFPGGGEISATSFFGNKFVIHVGGAGQQSNIYVNGALIFTANGGRDYMGNGYGEYRGDSYWVTFRQGVRTTSVRAEGGEGTSYFVWDSSRGRGGDGGDAGASFSQSGCSGWANNGANGSGGAVLISTDSAFYWSDRYKYGF